VRSVLTQEVKVIEAKKVNVCAALIKIKSGQLPFLGSSVQACRIWSIRATTRWQTRQEAGYGALLAQDALQSESKGLCEVASV
jgi:hypothetical protein